MRNIKVKDVMTHEVIMVPPTATVLEAARIMKESDCGFLPVGARHKIHGIVTDRDIVMRVVAEDASLQLLVSDILTPHVHFCGADDFIEDAVACMYRHNVMRLLVKNDQGSFAGVLSLTGILRHDVDPNEIVHAFKNAFYPGCNWRI